MRQSVALHRTFWISHMRITKIHMISHMIWCMRITWCHMISPRLPKTIPVKVIQTAFHWRQRCLRRKRWRWRRFLPENRNWKGGWQWGILKNWAGIQRRSICSSSRLSWLALALWMLQFPFGRRRHCIIILFGKERVGAYQDQYHQRSIQYTRNPTKLWFQDDSHKFHQKWLCHQDTGVHTRNALPDPSPTT